MSKNINKSKLYMIISVCILCISILGTTIAFYREELFNTNVSTITYGLDYYINYAKGQDISGAELLATDSYENGTSSDIELWKKDNTYDIYGHIYLDINEIGANLSTSSALKYTLVNNNNVIATGKLQGSAGDSILISHNIPLQTTKQLYTVYIWLDINENPSIEIESEVLSITVRCEATIKPIEIPVNLLGHITNLYTNGNPTLITQDVTNDTYYYSYQDKDKTWGLMNDGLKVAKTSGTGSITITDTTALTSGTEGNIRYFGPGDSVNNYIYFNCSNYDKQSSSTCEKWRIIGIVDGKVKIIRENSIGNLAWDQDKNQDSNLETFSNNWETSSLQLMLNSSYYNGDTSGTINYYSGGAGERSTSLNMGNIGIKNDITRNMISESTWYLGSSGSTCNGPYPNERYNCERTNIVLSGNPFTITANIGLLYVSDYGYGTNLTKCSEAMYSYSGEYSSECVANNWLFNGDTKWLITPKSTYFGQAFSVRSTGYADDGDSVPYSKHVTPVLYLDPNVIIDMGDGSSDNPYQITIKKPTTLIDHITSLYTNGKPTLITQQTSNDTYYYSYQDSTKTWGLMNDGLKVAETEGTGSTTITDRRKLKNGDEGNIRYFGPSASVNNYIYFNCSDYSNQSDSTCEKWRIIGIIDGKVKLIRDESIGNLAWDQDKNQDSSLTTYSNNWETSSLQLMLNNSYYNGNKAGTITYYSGYAGKTTTNLNMSSIGIKNDATRKMISTTTWYLGGYSASLYPDDLYNYERTNIEGTTILSGNPYTINTNIGLMYPSDYGYGTDLTKCSDYLNNYSNSVNSYACRSNNWLLYSSDQWLITPYWSDSTTAWGVDPSGYVFNSSSVYSTSADDSVRPVLYLDPNVIVNSGDGSSDKPYQIYIEPPRLIEHLTSLYTNADKTEVINNSITYNYAPSVNLMNDRAGNIRYYGASPSNYIYFNCSDYNNQSSETCETWRIIGIVDGKVKIIRDESIGVLALDQDKNQNSSLTTYSNNWETSSLQLMLNSSYYNGDTAGTITYYSGSTGEYSANLNMSSIGIKNNTTRQMISKSTWYLGRYGTESVYPNQIYYYERTNEYSVNPFTVETNIGIMYASDYGYAVDFNKCNTTLYKYNNNECNSNNWLHNGSKQWLINPNNSEYGWELYGDGHVDVFENGGIYSRNNVRPALYLSPMLDIDLNGDGTITNPYKIKV